jgi:undecaprenyl-diphosphatase
VLDWLVDHREPWITTVARAITRLGGSGLLVPIIVIVGLALLVTLRQVRPLVMLSASYLAAHQLSPWLKSIFDRDRPPSGTALAHLADPSFPSGHASQAAAVWAMLAAVLAPALPARLRPAVWPLALAIAVLVGLTRLYLGVHWLTDVIGGWALGAACCAAVLAVDRMVERSGRT